MPWSLYIGAVVGTWIVWKSLSLSRNYRAAKAIDLPLRICPFNALDAEWIFLYKTFPIIISLLRKLPFGLGDWAKYSYIGWGFDDKHASHRDAGPAFVLVTPSRNEVILADSAAAHTAHARWRDFVKSPAMYEQLNFFGPNLDSVNGDDWQRHRKLTAPNFNERISSIVWDETLLQARPMLEQWLRADDRGTNGLKADVTKLGLHVLTRVAFGISYPFNQVKDELLPGHRMSYITALSFMMRDWFYLLIFPKKLLAMPFVSKRFSRLGEAAQEFQSYMEEMLENEKTQGKREGGATNLISTLARASENASQAEADVVIRHSLNNEEIFGNIFIYNIAGHDTIANTTVFALALLAAHPKWQGWISEEICRTTKGPLKQEDWTYEATFPGLKRCLALMFETLRLYGPVPLIPKSTGFHQQHLTINGKSHIIPADTFIIINSQAIHTDPATWGQDSLSFRPDRWIEVSPSGAEELVDHGRPAGTFIPWSDGPRACPGRKFSQVEFCAVMASLFREHRVEPVLKAGEKADGGQRRLMAMINNAYIASVTLQMRDPEAVALKWRKV